MSRRPKAILQHMARTRVLVVDDDALMLEALRVFVDAAHDMVVVGEARDGHEAVAKALELRPDVILMDMQMPQLDGVEATEIIHEKLMETKILAVSSFATDRYVVRALRKGASAYLVKDTPPTELVEAIRRTLRGDAVLSPQVLRHVVAQIQEEPSSLRAPETVTKHISEREREVIQLLAAGNSNREIAEHLYLSEATVKSHLARIMAKLGARDRVQTVIRAHEYGLAELRLEG